MSSASAAVAERPLEVFVSSVMRPELMPYRSAAAAVLRTIAGVRPWVFEEAAASAEPVVEGYLRRARDADVVILLLSGDTTQPVAHEIAEVVAQRRRLWIYLLPGALTETSQQLLGRVRELARYKRVESPEELREEIRRTITDESVLAMRGAPALTRQALLNSGFRESLARCKARWAAVGVSESVASELAADHSVGAPLHEWWSSDEEPAVLLVGDFGSGKSLAAERMFQHVVRRAQMHGDVVTPVWLRASAAMVPGLGAAVLQLAEGIGDPRLSGAFVVVDGLDEVDRASADRIAVDAQILASTWPHTHVVLTSRPLHPIRGLAVRTTKLLSQEEALTVASRFAGRDVGIADLYGWPHDVCEAVRRPLFAVLIGLYMANADHTVPRSQGELLAYIVDQALRVSREPGEASYAALEELARRVIGGQPEVPAAELRAARHLEALLASGLVTSGTNGYGFPLPIISQWFGAQAILRDDPSSNDLIAASRLDQWRYPLIIAIATAGSGRVDAVLAPIARHDPGFAAELVDGGVPEWGLSQEVLAPPAMEAGARIRGATDAWVHGTGHLARLLQIVRADGSVPPLGVVSDGAWLSTAWYRGQAALDNVVPLPDEAHPFAGSVEWVGHRGARPSGSAGWNWRWSLSDFTHRLKHFLRDKTLPTTNVTLINEAQWAAACAVLGRGPLNFAPIEVPRLWQRLAEKLRHITDDRGFLAASTYRPEYDLRALEQHVDQLQAAGMDHWTLGRPYPDIDPPRGNWIWSGYSPEQLARLIEAVYKQAVPAYLELAEKWFTPFLGRLRHFQLFPARVAITVSPSRGDDYESEPGRDLLIEPLPTSSPTTFDVSVGGSAFPWPRTHLDEMSSRISDLRPSAADWLFPHMSTSVVSNYINADAVTNVVYNWLREDLKRIRWVD